MPPQGAVAAGIRAGPFNQTAKRVELQRCCQRNGALALDLVALQVEAAQAGARNEQLGKVGHAAVVDGIRAQVKRLRLGRPSKESLDQLTDRNRRKLQVGERDIGEAGYALEHVNEAGRGPVGLSQAIMSGKPRQSHGVRGCQGVRQCPGSEAVPILELTSTRLVTCSLPDGSQERAAAIGSITGSLCCAQAARYATRAGAAAPPPGSSIPRSKEFGQGGGNQGTRFGPSPTERFRRD